MNQRAHLIALVETIPELEVAVLIGSQVKGTATALSDWDIAIQWSKSINGWSRLEHTEMLKQKIANAIGLHKDQIDLIDINTTRLTMRAVIAEEGIVLKGENTLPWRHFLTQTWGELEDFYWRQNNAA